MKFKFIGNACGIFQSSGGQTLLCDPWIQNGVFEGSWCHYPPVKTIMSDLRHVDGIYISHLHPDHFDVRTFTQFSKDKPIFILDHGQNFLWKILKQLGFTSIHVIPDGEKEDFGDFRLHMFAPFTKHNFHEARIGNLIDSALVVEADGYKALNTNDNTPTPEACKVLRDRFGLIDLAMLNYNAAGPYPSCFENLDDVMKRSEHRRILDRNLAYMADLVKSLEPRMVLPFAGAYVLGGREWKKNEFLGTTTWDEAKDFLDQRLPKTTTTVVMLEGQILNLENGELDGEYCRISLEEMKEYIETELANIQYPYEQDEYPEEDVLLRDVKEASEKMLVRMERLGIKSNFRVYLELFDFMVQIYPVFDTSIDLEKNFLRCRLDERLLKRILERKAHWNNAEIGAHISFWRNPNRYEPDLHTGLQFFHL